MVNADTGVHPNLLNSRFGYVAMSRASHEATLFTNDVTKLTPKRGIREGYLLSFSGSDGAIARTDQTCKVCSPCALIFKSPLYSCLNASIGCTPAARRAGIQLAAKATAIKAKTPAVIVAGSYD